MGTLPPGLVAGNHYTIYDAFYQQLDPTNKGSVGALEAARFLKTSGISDVILSKIWDLADANGKGYLTKSGFFVALKLVALVQAGKEPTTVNLSLDVPPPIMANVTVPGANKSTFNRISPTRVPMCDSEWIMKPADKLKYEQLFDTLSPTNGFMPGNKVKGLLMDSKLPVDTLGKIWDLADVDKDGALDRHEFAVAMHLVYKALEKYKVPASLPPELLPPSKRKESVSMPGAVPVLPAIPNGVRSETPVSRNVISPVTQPTTNIPLVQPISIPPMQSIPGSVSISSAPAQSLIQPVTIQPIPAPPLIPSMTTPPLIPSVTTPPLIPSVTTPLIPAATTPLVTSSVPDVVAPIAKPLGGLPPPVQAIPPLQNVPMAAFSIDNLLSPEESWVISKEEKVKYDALFEQADLDRDGFVSGHEIKDTFLKSGVAQPVLAHIWSLCDTAEQGKLNNEQFALALWLISRKLKGIDPPPKLTSEMVPPSCRKPSLDTSSNEPIVFTSPEVDRLTREIDDLMKEKLILETNITQREADIKIKTGEIKSLQSELDTLVAMLKQLENQKGEANKRINDLKAQSIELESKLNNLKIELEVEQTEVNKLKQQAEEQEKQLKSQEAELNRKKQELKDLMAEEENLRREKENLKKEIENVTKSSTETTEIINEIRSKLIELDDFQLQLKEAVTHLDSVLESKTVTSLSEVYMNVEPKFKNQSYTSLFDRIHKLTNPKTEADPFSDNNTQTKTTNVDFSKTDVFTNDPFASKDVFGSDFNSNKLSSKAFSADPFASFEPSNSQKADPFADSLSSSKPNVQKDEDPFGCDPFAILHAPTKPGSNLPSPSVPRSESPSPALPPKKCKQPPPRPAPPRPAPPSLPSGFDADFADFSGFSHKTVGQPGISTTLKREPLSKPDAKKDLFRDYRYEDPFEMADEDKLFRGASAPPLMDTKNNAFDPFFKSDPFASTTLSNGLSKSTTPFPNTIVPEEKQLAWATTESVKSEKERRKRAEQEKNDYKLALKLSKAEGKKKSFRSKILS